MAGNTIRLGLQIKSEGGKSTAQDILQIKRSIEDVGKSSDGIAKLVEQTKKLAESVGLDADKMEEAVRMLKVLNAASVDSATKFQVLNSKLGITAQQLDAIEKTIKLEGAIENLKKLKKGFEDGLVEPVEQSKNLLQELRQGFTELILLEKLKELGQQAFNTGLEFERLKTTLKTTLGGQKSAEAAFEQIQQFAASTPFQVSEVTQAFISLQNRGINPTNENLRKLGDLSSSQGKQLQQAVEAVLDAASGENERLKEFGIQAQQAGDKVSFTFKGVKTTVEKTPEAIAAAIFAFGELKGVAGGMEEQSKTLGGSLSNLEDNTDKLSVTLFELAQGPAVALVGAANNLIGSFLGLPAPVQKTVVGIAGLTLVLGLAITAVAAFEAAQIKQKIQFVANTGATIVNTVAKQAAAVTELALAVATGKATEAQLAQANAFAASALQAGLFAGAIASIALAVDTYNKVNAASSELQSGTQKVADSLVALKEIQAANSKEGEKQAKIYDLQGAAFARNQQAIGGVQQALDVLRDVLAKVSFKGLLEEFARLEAIPAPLRDLINNVAKAFPGVATAAEASANKTQEAFGDLIVGAETVSREFNELKFKGFDKATKEEVEALTKSVDASIETLEKSQPVDEASATSKRIYLESLKANKKELEEVTQRLKDQSQALAVLGTESEQLANKNKELTDKFLRGIGTNDQAKQLQQTILRQKELGDVTAAEAERQLEAIRTNTRLDAETTKSASEAITKIKKEAGDQQIADIQQQQTDIQTLVQQGALSQVEAEKQLTDLKQQELETRIANIQAAILREINEGRGNGDRAKALIAEEKKLQSQLTQSRAEGEKQDRAQRLKDFDERQAILEGQLARGQVTEQEFAKKSLEIGQQKADEEISQLQEQLNKLAETDIEGREAINAQLAGVYKRRADIEASYYRQQVELIERATRKVSDAITLAETEREIEIQKLLNQGVITQRQAEERKLQSSRKRIQDELKAEQEKLAKLRALPDPTNPADREQREAQIRQSVQATANLTKQLAENEASQQEALKQAVIKRIKDQTNEQQLATDKAVRGLEKVKASQDAISSAIERQLKLKGEIDKLDKAIETARLSAAEGELSSFDKAVDLRKQLAKVDNPEKRQILQRAISDLGLQAGLSELQLVERRQQLEDQIAQQKLQNLANEQARARVALELELQRQEVSAKRAVTEAKIAEAQAQQQVNAALAAQREAEQIQDPEERKTALANAQSQLEGAQQGLELAQGASADAKQGLTDQAFSAQKAREALQVQQQQEFATAQTTEKFRELDQSLTLVDAKAQALADSMASAADFIAKFFANAGIANPFKKPEARAGGGPVVPGKPYLVGERGPELIVPTNSGHVMTAAQTAALLSNAQVGAGVSLPAELGGTANSQQVGTLIKELQGLRSDIAARRPVNPQFNLPPGSQGGMNSVFEVLDLIRGSMPI